MCPNAAYGTEGLSRGWTVRHQASNEHVPCLAPPARPTPRLDRAAVESLTHSSELPSALVDKVPQREKLILSFVLAFIKDQARSPPSPSPSPSPSHSPSFESREEARRRRPHRDGEGAGADKGRAKFQRSGAQYFAPPVAR